jgi:CheY-like chemotaxis protein
MSQHSKLQHVLVVDDDPIIRDMMVDIFDFEGHNICVARNGHEALAILRGEPGYLVFLDLMMPGMSGKEVCAILDADPALRSRHVIILMSAMDKLEDGTSLKADALIPKPFTVDDVLEVVKPYLE